MLLSLTEIVHSGSRPTVTFAAAEVDALARRQHERTHARAGRCLAELADDVEAPRLEVVVDRQLDGDRAHEVVALFAGVLASGFAEFGDEGVLDVVEAVVVDGAEQHREVVRDDAPTLHVDGSVVVHLAYETASEFDGPDRPAGAAKEHTVDHTLQTVLQ